MKSKKGTVQLYIMGTVLALIILFFVAVLSPAGVVINTEFTKVADDMRTRYSPELMKIENETIRNSVMEAINTGVDNSANMVEVNNFFYKYGWFFVILIPLAAIFIYSRMQVETTSGGGLA